MTPKNQVVTFQVTPRPSSSVWGQVDSAMQLAPGLWEVHTPSHGGIVLSPERLQAMPTLLRAHQPFGGHRSNSHSYEEDCDWCIPMLAWWPEIALAQGWPDAHRAYVMRHAVSTAMCWIKTPEVKTWLHTTPEGASAQAEAARHTVDATNTDSSGVSA